jgi:hypothetical protein
MKRPMRQEDGMYHVKGSKYPELIGSRPMVWHGTAYKTEGGLIKDQLVMNKWNRIVSKKKHQTAKIEKRLEKHGYFAEKGRFGYVKKQSKRNSKGSPKTRRRSGRTVGKIKIY